MTAPNTNRAFMRITSTVSVKPSHEPFLRTVAFRPLQRWTPESARKQPEGCGPHDFRFKGHVQGPEANAASHEPDGRASLSPASRVGRVPGAWTGSPGRTRPTSFMSPVQGAVAMETSHEPIHPFAPPRRGRVGSDPSALNWLIPNFAPRSRRRSNSAEFLVRSPSKLLTDAPGLRACPKIARGPAARDFGCGQGGEVRASPTRAVRTEPTQATDKRPAARRVFAPKAAWLRCSSVEDPGRIFSFVAPRHPAFGAKTGPRGIFGHALRPHTCNPNGKPVCRPVRGSTFCV